jgi:outer membrane protein assembly factor BamA
MLYPRGTRLCYSFSTMIRKSILLLTALALLSALPAAAQKKSSSNAKKTASSGAQPTFTPKSILFKGAPGYSDQELLDGVGLKPGTPIVYSTVKAHLQKLLETGLFTSASFTYNGGALVFNLVLSSALYPLRLENLPLTPGKDLEAALHARLPLFHGKIPFDGGLTEEVRKALVEMLAAKGIQATVAAQPYTDQKLFQVTAMNYAITAPKVLVGEIRLEGAQATPDPGVLQTLASLKGAAYSIEGSSGEIEGALGDSFRDNGYLEAEVHAAARDEPVVAPEAIYIPFQVAASPGMRYKLAGIRLAPGLLLSQAEFDKQARIPPGAFAVASYVRDNWSTIERQYHNKGYMEAAVHAKPSFDRAQGTVSFAVSVDPGPVYTMGKLVIQNGADDLRAAMLAAWKMPTGVVFNEGAMRGFYAKLPPKSPLARTMIDADLMFAAKLNRDTHTVDITLRMEKKR